MSRLELLQQKAHLEELLAALPEWAVEQYRFLEGKLRVLERKVENS